MRRVVAHYVDAHTYGGVEQVVRLLLSAIDRERWTPLLYVHDRPGIHRLIEEAHKLEITAVTVPAPASATDVRAWREFRARLVRDRPDVFHAHLNWPLGARHGILAARLAGLRYVVATAHLYVPISGISWPRAKQWLQAAAVNRYIAVSAEVATQFRRELGVRADKLCVVHNGIEVPSVIRACDPGLRADLVQSQERPIVLTVARLHAQKGLDHLLEAATSLPEVLFAIAGDGPERERLQSRARQLGVDSQIRFLGNRVDAPALLAAADLFVLPSLYEGLPLSVLEAMAAGLPVVATSIGGTSEAVVHGGTGWLVPPGDSHALATAVQAALRDRGVAAKFGQAGRERVQAKFSVESMTRAVERIYERDLATLAGSHLEDTA